MLYHLTAYKLKQNYREIIIFIAIEQSLCLCNNKIKTNAIQKKGSSHIEKKDRVTTRVTMLFFCCFGFKLFTASVI